MSEPLSPADHLLRLAGLLAVSLVIGSFVYHCRSKPEIPPTPARTTQAKVDPVQARACGDTVFSGPLVLMGEGFDSTAESNRLRERMQATFCAAFPGCAPIDFKRFEESLRPLSQSDSVRMRLLVDASGRIHRVEDARGWSRPGPPMAMGPLADLKLEGTQGRSGTAMATVVFVGPKRIPWLRLRWFSFRGDGPPKHPEDGFAFANEEDQLRISRKEVQRVIDATAEALPGIQNSYQPHGLVPEGKVELVLTLTESGKVGLAELASSSTGCLRMDREILGHFLRQTFPPVPTGTVRVRFLVDLALVRESDPPGHSRIGFIQFQ